MLGLLVAFSVLGWGLLRDVAAPWTDNIDANGACWSQSAHNTLRAGLKATLGVPSFACTPDAFPDLLAAALEGRDVGRWANEHGLHTAAVASG